MNVIKSWFSKTQTYILLILIVYCIFVAIVSPSFLSLNTLFEFLGTTSSYFMILALGAFVVLLSGGLDVSFTSIAVFGAYTSVRVLQITGIESVLFGFIIAIAVGAALGLINALVIHAFKLPTLIATLATQSIYIGLLATVVGTASVNTTVYPQCLKAFGSANMITIINENGTVFGLRAFFIITIVILVLTWFILNRTMIGRGVVALGNSEESAMRVGFNLLKIRLFVYVYVGIVSAIAGVILFAQVAWLTPISNELLGSELTIIAAVIIGGAKLTGGEGTIFGTILGVMLVKLFDTTLILIGLSTSWNNFFTGLILLVILTWTSVQRYAQKRRMLLFED